MCQKVDKNCKELIALNLLRDINKREIIQILFDH